MKQTNRETESISPPAPVIEVYQFRVYLREISPEIWRRFLMRSDSTLADLHATLQILLDWSDDHLHQFLIRGKTYGIYRAGCIWYDHSALAVKLSEIHLRLKEKCIDEYDFFGHWQHELRLEQTLPLDPNQVYSGLYRRRTCPIPRRLRRSLGFYGTKRCSYSRSSLAAFDGRFGRWRDTGSGLPP